MKTRQRKLEPIFSPQGAIVAMGAPRYIPSEEIKLPNSFRTFTNPYDKSLTQGHDQVDMLDEHVMDQNDHGWLTYACGSLPLIKTLAVYYMSHLHVGAVPTQWIHIGPYFIKDPAPEARGVILDAVTVFGEPGKNDDLVIDTRLLANLYNFISRHRGRISIMVLCPNFPPARLKHYLIEYPDLVFLVQNPNTGSSR